MKPRRSLFRRIIVPVLVVFHVVGIFSAVDAVMSTRTAPGAIAWSLSLVTAPVVAVPAYWVFGRNKFEGYLEARREAGEDYGRRVDRLIANMDSSVVEFEMRTPAYDAIRGLSRMRLTKGNRAELLVDGDRCRRGFPFRRAGELRSDR